MYQTIDRSDRLRRRLGLEPDQSATWTSTFPHTRDKSFSCILESSISFISTWGEEGTRVEGQTLTACVELPGRRALPTVGHKIRSMLICQLPIEQMHVYLGCCGHDP